MTATALTLAMFLIPGSASQVDGVVLCVGPDGHVEIETIFDGCCISGAAGVRGEAVEPSATGSVCNDCTDVQRKVPPLRSNEIRPLQPDSDAECVACSLCSGAGNATRTADVPDMDHHCNALTAISTVVLLT